MNILVINNLSVNYQTEENLKLSILSNIDLNLEKGKTHALMGESGSGKSVLALAIMRLLPPIKSYSNPSKEIVQEILTDEIGLPKNIFRKYLDSKKSFISSIFSPKTVAPEYHHLWEIEGEVLFEDKNLFALTEMAMNQIRGKEITLIWQHPIAAMNPSMIIGEQTGEPLEIHSQINQERLRTLVVDFLGKVDIHDPKKRYANIPREFSKGEGQRIMLSMALIAGPKLLIADEPLASLDTTVQRRVMELLKILKAEFNLSLLLITHNLGVIAEMADSVSVLYAGRIVETGSVRDIYKKPLHPYTQGLLSAIPWIEPVSELKPIPGDLPDPLKPISGCAFHPRCYRAQNNCFNQIPKSKEVDPGHKVACFLFE